MQRLILFFTLIILTLHSSPSFAAGETVKAWITTTTSTWVARGLEPCDSAVFGQDTQHADMVLSVNEKIKYQQWEGAGASFTDGAAWLVDSVVKPELRDSLMTALFDPVKGIGVSYLRNPMGSSDLTLERYTYDDSAADKYDSMLPNFSINHDRRDVLPLTKRARALNPALTLQMNAWSPPAWMKSNNSLVGGEILPACYPHHVNYYLKTIQAYDAEGVHINYVTLNNEPSCCDSIDYPSVSIMGSDAMHTMLTSYWLPAFAAAKLTTKILLLDFNWDHFSLVQPFLNDPAIQYSPIIGGVAFHGYGGDPSLQTTVFDQGYNVYFTEWSGFTDGRPQQEADMRKMVAVIRDFSRSFVKWPIAADEQNGPHVGGCSDCRGLVRVWRYDASKQGTFDFRIDYYDIGHITKFVSNGAYRIQSTYDNQLLNVAFVNPDQSIALLVFNDTLADKTVRVVWGGQSFSYLVPSKASFTFKWAPTVSISERMAQAAAFGRRVWARQSADGISLKFPSVNTYAVELFAMSGRALIKKIVSGDRAALNTRGLGTGIYMVKITCGKCSLQPFHWIIGN
ncbi:MAG TPA: glycoside hydrolase family 30 beta sandwich domain-containing protein [Chitinivibrionales bacterium]|nr:glycoside hydrolase family 30 beta sandwich domain-containing protein [Chitinivibrionales bacterium]